MGRYLAARKPLERLLSIEPAHAGGLSLMREVDQTLASFGNARSGMRGGMVPQTRRPELVMVVDQDESVLQQLMGSLRKFGFRAVSAGGFQEARELLTRVTPDMIISEVNFENGPLGFDLYLLVRTNARLQDIPFLFLATRVDRETLIAGKRLGVNDFVLKPLDEDVVYASMISSLARVRRLRAASV